MTQSKAKQSKAKQSRIFSNSKKCRKKQSKAKWSPKTPKFDPKAKQSKVKQSKAATLVTSPPLSPAVQNNGR